MSPNQPHVLVIDDNVANLELARFLLEEDGMCVDVATDPTEVAERLGAQKPDLILMDIQMPGRDGLSITRELKSLTSTRDIVIVAFTAYAMTGDASKLLAAGCDAYISKPVDVKTFASTVRSHLRGIEERAQ
ncbi:MAG TPA: response regulator [Aquabacterium sp.]|nr:response regulator [Aquabacterium sp.]